MDQEQRQQLLYYARLEAIKLYAKEGDILNWGRLLFPEKFGLPFCEDLHNYLVDTAEDDFTSTLAPRGHAKTTISCFLIPIFYALNFPDMYYHYLNVQSTSTKAIEVNVSIKKEIEENQALIDIYGNQMSETKWTEKRFVLKNGVIFSCAGARESMRGIQHNNKRPDYIIVDDLYDDDDINNADMVNKKNRWFWSTLYPARAKSKKHSVHIQGTAISKIDLMHSLPETIKYKAIINDKPLWKELWTLEQLLAEKEKIGSIIFAREYMNDVRDDETSIIRQSWIKFYKHSQFNQLGLNIKKVIAGLDPACGENALNDFSGYAIIHVDENYNVYIENVCEAKNSFNANMNMVEQWDNRYQPDVFRIEAISGFKQLTDEVKRTKNVKLKAITTVKDKITRLELQSFRFENGKVFINSEMNKKEMDNLIEQLINNFPPHDDVRDAVIVAMEEIDRMKGVAVKRM